MEYYKTYLFKSNFLKMLFLIKVPLVNPLVELTYTKLYSCICFNISGDFTEGFVCVSLIAIFIKHFMTKIMAENWCLLAFLQYRLFYKVQKKRYFDKSE